jgi:NAD(P)H-quinone oxidoreductase subunit 5
VLFGLAGGALFMWMTSKTSLTSTSIFLTIVVAITVGQTSLNIIKEPSMNYAKRIGLSLALFIAGIAMYALAYNGISFILQDVSYSLFPHELTYAEIIFGLLFLVGFLLMRIGIYRKTPWLYVKLLNVTQPHQTTVLKFKK